MADAPISDAMWLGQNIGTLRTLVDRAGYVHTQASAATTWTVNHNLGFYPVIDVLSPGLVVVGADVAHVSVNQATVSFNLPYSGQAIAR